MNLRKIVKNSNSRLCSGLKINYFYLYNLKTKPMEAVLIIVYLAVIALMVVSMWIIYAKAGKPGWAVLIPIYNIIVFMEIIKKPWWWLFLWMIPFVNFVFIIWSWNLLVKKFGKSEGFTVGVILLSFIFIPILAFDGSGYEGLEESGARVPDAAGTADVLLLIVILFMLVNTLTLLLMNKFSPGWYSRPTRYIWSSLNMIYAFIPVVLGVVIRNKTLKIIGIIFGALLAILMLVQNIASLARGFY